MNWTSFPSRLNKIFTSKKLLISTSIDTKSSLQASHETCGPFPWNYSLGFDKMNILFSTSLTKIFTSNKLLISTLTSHVTRRPISWSRSLKKLKKLNLICSTCFKKIFADKMLLISISIVTKSTLQTGLFLDIVR